MLQPEKPEFVNDKATLPDPIPGNIEAWLHTSGFSCNTDVCDSAGELVGEIDCSGFFMPLGSEETTLQACCADIIASIETLCDKVENQPLATVENAAICAIRTADGVEGFIEVIRDEAGTIVKYVFTGFDGSVDDDLPSVAGYERCKDDNASVFITDHCPNGNTVYASIDGDECKYFEIIDGVKTEIMAESLGTPISQQAPICETQTVCLDLIVTEGDTTYGDIVAAALAQFAVNGDTWANTDPITLDATDQGCVNEMKIIVAGCHMDGVTLEANSVSANGGPALSSGAVIQLGGGANPPGQAIDENDFVTVVAGGGFVPTVEVSRCRDAKSGDLIAKNA